MKTMAEIQKEIFRVTIVGCPNVGKSSLFNRIVRKRTAIVYRESGTTRDRISQEVRFKNKKFLLTDTGGFITEDQDQLLKLVKVQIKKAIDESDILLFVCDGQAGLNANDLEFADILRKTNKRIFLAVNKADNTKIEDQVLDFYRLGLDKPYPVSALHDIGIDALLDDLIRSFPDAHAEEEKRQFIKTAIVGRPNVGKSSFLNCLLNEERVIVDKAPGTTRDTVDTFLKKGETEFLLIDTAGLRHKKKIKEAVDVYGMMRTVEAIKRSEICLVLIDGYDGIRLDDLKILDLVLKEGKCCILCVNKWDLVKEVPVDKYKEMIYSRAHFLKNYPILFTSAKNGHNIYRALDMIKEIIKNSYTEISTPKLNKILSSIKFRGPFTSRKNKIKLHYGTQIKVRPPVFLIFVDDPAKVSEEQINFIENSFRKIFNFFGVPLRFKFRSTKGGEK